MIAGAYFRSFPPVQYILYIIVFKILLSVPDGLQHIEQFARGVDLLLGMEAVVAVAAIVLVILLAEVVEQQFAAAYGALGVAGRGFEQLAPDVLLGYRLPLHELLELLEVVVGVERYAASLATVTAGAPRLLIVALEALGHVVVYHEAHVGLVDAHAEGYCGHYHVYPLHDEVVLRLAAGGCVHSGVVRRGGDVVGLQHGGELFHPFTGETVDDAAFAGVLFDVFYNLLVDVARLGPHLVVEIGTVEGALEVLRLLDAQAVLDVLAHLVGGCGSEGDDGRSADTLDDVVQVAVLGAEVVAPLRDAVGLVDGVEGYLRAAEKLDILVLGQRLGRHVEELSPPVADIVLHLFDRLLVEHGIEEMGYAVALAGVADHVHLIFHERDERRDHNGHTVHYQGRQLIAQRLASARRHQHKCIAPRKQIADYSLLVTLECIETEILFQFCREIYSFATHICLCFHVNKTKIAISFRLRHVSPPFLCPERHFSLRSRLYFVRCEAL